MFTRLLIMAAALASFTLSTAAAVESPYLKANGTWIDISGTVVAPKADTFTLDYGKGKVTVEMDDWDWYGDTPAGIDGDKVTVYGQIDDDFFETTTIEASSVYVENRGTYYYASSDDEEDDAYMVNYWVTSAPIVVGDTVVRGTVTGVSGREFTVNTGAQKVSVDTIDMSYNPLDDQGIPRVDEGDYVSVRGNIDASFWDETELSADSFIVLVNDKE